MRHPAKKFLRNGLALGSIASLGLALPAMAQLSKQSGLDETAGAAGVTNFTIYGLAGTIIQLMLIFAGMLSLILMIYAGFLWMTAQGSEEKIKKAKNLITGTVIGLIIIASSYAITGFVINSILTAATQ